MQDWYIIQFKRDRHRLAECNLNRQGFKTFLPVHIISRRKSAKFVDKLVPLFPGYMFVMMGATKRESQKINSTYGVSKLVQFGEEPYRVPTEVISILKNQCDHSGRFYSNKNLDEGDLIEISNGPFANFIGTIDAIDAKQRITVLLNFMGQPTRIKTSFETSYQLLTSD